MNTGFYKDLDTNFQEACEMSEREFSHEELIQLLENGNIPQKQIAALKLNCIFNQEEADILINNLTGCDGKIREAVALKINNLLRSDKDLSLYFYPHSEIFADATIDINANICRLVVDSVDILKADYNFTKIYLDKILVFIEEAFKELDSFIFRDKKYVINKQLFVNIGTSIKNLLTLKRPRCTHMGCSLNYNKEEKVYECPCHGSRFDNKGNVLNGPAKKNKNL